MTEYELFAVDLAREAEDTAELQEVRRVLAAAGRAVAGLAIV